MSIMSPNTSRETATPLTDDCKLIERSSTTPPFD